MQRILVIPILALILGEAGPAIADPYVTMVDNGPSSNRIDMVFLGDGYTATDLAGGVLVEHIDNYLDHMFSNSLNSDPFYRYRNFFNVHRIDVVSNESGADVPPEDIYRDTALDAKYYYDGTTERLLYISNSKANAARDAALSGAGFDAEMQLVTVNDTRYGGAGGSYAVFAGGNSSASEIALHELGHSFSDLADEYGGFTDPYVGGEPTEINVTTDPTGAKWSRWHGYDQPGIGTIGAYEGGRYYDAGIYRPSVNSKMRNLGRPFDAVGREKLILDIYEYVDPFDSWSDNSLPLVDPGALMVEPIDDGVIDIEWFVDGELIPSAGGESFDLTEFGFGLGDYAISVRGFDPTAFDLVNGWVRMNQDRLEQFIYWDVTISIPDLFEADFDEDGDVDGDDFLAWQTGFGTESAAIRSDGDADADGDVDGDDFLVWQSQFGNSAGQGASAAIPEPTSALLIMLGGAASMLLSRARPDSASWCRH